GTRHALITVAEAVIGAAGGCVPDEDLARVIESRFELVGAPLFTSLETDEGLAIDPPTAPEEQPEALVTNEARARELWAALTATERTALALVGSPKAIAEA